MNSVNNKDWSTRIQEQKRRSVFYLLISTLLFCLIFFIAYYWWIGELQFLGKETVLVKAKVKSEKRYHWGEGLYRQKGMCEYVFEEKRHISKYEIKDFRAITSPKIVKIGDSVLIKIAKEYPKTILS